MPNIYEFKRLYRRTEKEKAGASDPHRITIDKVDSGVLRVLTHVTVEDTTSNYTKCRIGIANAGRDHYLNELTSITANELAVSTSLIILGEGDVFFAELTGITSGDELVLTCVGWELDL